MKSKKCQRKGCKNTAQVWFTPYMGISEHICMEHYKQKFDKGDTKYQKR